MPALYSGLATVLSSEQATFWWIALVIGLVVVAVVIVLLTLLSRLLNDVVTGVAALQEIAEGVERDTPGDDLPATAASLRELHTEIKLQDDMLGRWTQRST
jgi:hypothetical protein